MSFVQKGIFAIRYIKEKSLVQVINRLGQIKVEYWNRRPANAGLDRKGKTGDACEKKRKTERRDTRIPH